MVIVCGNICSGSSDVVVIIAKLVLKSLDSEAIVKYQNPTYKRSSLIEDKVVDAAAQENSIINSRIKQ